VTKTRFKLRPHHVSRWLEHFGKIVQPPNYEDASDLASVKSYDIGLTIILRKHVPVILPAYGRRIMIKYPGQPILCGRCFELRPCEKEL